MEHLICQTMVKGIHWKKENPFLNIGKPLILTVHEIGYITIEPQSDFL